MDKAPISTLPGIGPITQGWLEEAGFGSVRDLRNLGSVEIYRRLKFLRPRQVNLNALYGLEAALRSCHWLALPADVKTSLQQEARAIDTALRKGGGARCAMR